MHEWSGLGRFVYLNAALEHPISLEVLLTSAESIARGAGRQ